MKYKIPDAAQLSASVGSIGVVVSGSFSPVEDEDLAKILNSILITLLMELSILGNIWVGKKNMVPSPFIKLFTPWKIMVEGSRNVFLLMLLHADGSSKNTVKFVMLGSEQASLSVVKNNIQFIVVVEWKWNQQLFRTSQSYELFKVVCFVYCLSDWDLMCNIDAGNPK